MNVVLDKKSCGENNISTSICFVEQTWNAKSLTQTHSIFNNLEVIAQNHLLQGNKFEFTFISSFNELDQFFQQTECYFDLICSDSKMDLSTMMNR